MRQFIDGRPFREALTVVYDKGMTEVRMGECWECAFLCTYYFAILGELCRLEGCRETKDPQFAKECCHGQAEPDCADDRDKDAGAECTREQGQHGELWRCG